MTQIDMSKTIEAKSDQLNADDLIGGPLTIRITRVSEGSSPEQPISIGFEGDNGKPYKPCKGMRRVMVHCWGKYANEYVGRSMTVYRDPSVKWAGQAVGGIRITHMSHISESHEMAVTVAKGSKKSIKIMPLKPEPMPAAASPDILSAGNAAASGGVKSYTDWLGTLTPEVKATVKPYHAEWSKTAKAAESPVEDMPL